MLMKYDVLIIGAGPSGLFCAHELLRTANVKVAILDIGKKYVSKDCPLLLDKRCAHCKPCSTLTGEGGAAFFHSGKLSFYPAGSGLKKILKDDASCVKVYGRIKHIFKHYGVILESDDKEAREYFESYIQDGINMKYYKSVPVEKEKFEQFMQIFGTIIKENSEMYFETEVLDFDYNSGWNVIASHKGSMLNFKSEKLVIATGEYGFRWWNNIAAKHEIKRVPPHVDIGVRVECPSELIEKIWTFHKDIKAKMIAPDGSEIRTYCVLKNGQSIYCNHDDFSVLDGISNPNSKFAGITIFNRLGTEHLNGKNPIEYAISYLKRFYERHVEPICVCMADFLYNSSGKTFSEKYNSTLNSVEYVKYQQDLPDIIYRNLVYGVKCFEKVIPGLSDDNNSVLIPVVDNFWNKIDLSEGMNASIVGLYVIGDATGIMRGIMQACVTGVLCADQIIKELQEKSEYEENG